MLSAIVVVFQDAKKGVLFIDFPPVLQLQLKRFEYDFMRDTMVKVGIGISRFSSFYALFVPYLPYMYIQYSISSCIGHRAF